MTFRILVLTFVCSGIAASTAVAQFSVPKSQLDYVEAELKKARDELSEKVSAANYQDPGADLGWSISQSAWEQMESKIGFPTPPIEKLISKDPNQRTDWEKSLLRQFYLGFVNEKTEPELRPLAERVELLRLHKRAKEIGITDPISESISKRFWKRRFVDAYRAKNQNKPETEALVIKFLNRAAANYALDGRLDNLTDSYCRDCLKTGCRHPILLTLALQVKSPHTQNLTAGIRSELPQLIAQLRSQEYSPMLRMLAFEAQWDSFRIKNKVDGKESNRAKANEIAKAYNQAILAMLIEESKCPENIESLKFVLNYMLGSDFRDARHLKSLYELLSKSNLHEGFKQAALQKLSARLIRKRELELDVRKEYVKAAIKHGNSATELLPLSVVVVENMIADTFTNSEPEQPKKWFEIGRQRAPGRYTLYKRYFGAFAPIADLEDESEFILGILTSDAYAAGVPWIGVRLINGGVGSYWTKPGEKDVSDDREVILALDALIQKAPDQGMSPDWCKSQKQFLNHLMLQAGFFEDALRIGKELKGDFGKYEYKNQKLTIARIAKLCNPLARETQVSIDDGTLDVAKIGETIEKLTEARMDMGTNEGTYIDELLDLLGSIESFESGEWAELTPKAVHLSNWIGGHHHGDWQATTNGVSTYTNSTAVPRELGWRWKVKSEYVVEADIEITSMKDYSKKFGVESGLGISNGRFISIPAVEVLINPYKSFASINAFREKKFWAKLNQEGTNRVRMRVWKDYFEFTINGKLVGQYVMESAIPGHVILRKGYGAARTTFSNIRVRKLTTPSPTGERLDDVFYWSKRLRHEPESKDIQLALERAKAKQNDDKQDPEVAARPEREPAKVNDGLVAMWTFDQDLSESVSKQETHSALPTQLVDGKVGSGLLLSGKNTSNLIVADGGGPIDLGGPFTISFWMRTETKQGVVISQSGERAHLRVNFFDGTLAINHQRPGLALSASLRAFPQKTWKHITITYDGSTENSKGIKVFVDGKKRNDVSYYGFLPEGRELPPIDSSKTQMHFGCHPFGERLYFGNNAVIDEVRVYDRLLSADEVKQVKSYGLK